jgi:hypothetical protein
MPVIWGGRLAKAFTNIDHKMGEFLQVENPPTDLFFNEETYSQDTWTAMRDDGWGHFVHPHFRLIDRL